VELKEIFRKNKKQARQRKNTRLKTKEKRFPGHNSPWKRKKTHCLKNLKRGKKGKFG